MVFSGCSQQFFSSLARHFMFLITLWGFSSSLAAQVEPFAGIWTGNWMSGFGGGSITLDVVGAGEEMIAEVTLTGTIFGDPGPHEPFIMQGVFDPATGVTFTDPDNPIYGPLTIYILLDGSGMAHAPNVPSPLIDSAEGTGQLDLVNKTGMGTGTPTPNFGGDANSTFTIALTSAAAPEFFFPQIGEGVSGTINFSTLTVLENTLSSAQPVTIDYFSTPDGAPMEMNLMGVGTASSFDFNLEAGETIFLQTSGTTAQLQVGYARVTAPDGVFGTGIFTRQDGGTTVTKAGVPASKVISDFSVPVDTRGANNIGLALVNPPATNSASTQAVANITMRLYDNDFNLLGTKTFDLAQGAHLPRFVTDSDFFGGVPGVDEMTGSITLTSSSPIAAVVLLQDDDAAVPFPSDVPILTAFPVINGRADATALAGGNDVSQQSVRARIVVPSSGPRSVGAIYRIYRGEVELDRLLRQVPSSGEVEESFRLPSGVDPANVSISVQFLYADGGQSPESKLDRAALIP